MDQIILYQSCSDYLKIELDLSATIIVYSPFTMGRRLFLDDVANASKATMISSHVEFDDLLASISDTQKSLKLVVGIGGGTCIDKAKFIAKKMDLDCVAIPSMLSTNVFATDKIAYIDRNGNKSTIDGVLPDTVVFDEKLIKSSHEYSIYGLADALSSLIALKDWEIAEAAGVEPIDKECYVDSALMLAKAKKIIREGKFEDKDIFEVLLEAGYVTNKYGTGRPESGSEHIIAKSLEHLVKIPHAVAVCFGMLISSQFHNCFDEVVDLITHIGIIGEVISLPYEVLKTSLVGLKPRPDRYSILDTLSSELLSPWAVDQYLRRMYRAFGVNEGAVIFDLDGVLWDSIAEVQEVYQKSLDIPEATLKKFMGKQFTHLAKSLGISPNTLASIQVKEIAYLMDKPGDIYEGVIDVLDSLKASGRELFIVSNCQKGYINTFLENYGLSTYFTEWRYDDRSSDTPKATNIRQLAEKYSLRRAVYIGDTEEDFIAADQAGVDFIAADYGFGVISKEATIRISDIRDLVTLLENRI